jgi:hypothetical protein
LAVTGWDDWDALLVWLIRRSYLTRI